MGLDEAARALFEAHNDLATARRLVDHDREMELRKIIPELEVEVLKKQFALPVAKSFDERMAEPRAAEDAEGSDG